MSRSRDRPEAQPAGLVRAGHDGQAELALVLDMVRIAVRPQDVARTDVPAFGRPGEAARAARPSPRRRPLRPPRRRRDRRSREPPGMHASRDEHGRVGYASNEEEDSVAGLIERMSLVIKSKLNKLLDRAEDPAETLDYSYEQRQLLQNVKRGSRTSRPPRSGQLQTDKLEQSLVKLDSLRDAVAAGREDLARAALERKTLAQQQLQDLDGQIEQLDQQQQKLAASEKLGAKIEAFRSQKEVIKAQYSAAEAQGPDRRGGDRDRRADGRHGARDRAGARQDGADAGSGVGGRRADRGGDRRTSPRATRPSSTVSWPRSRPTGRSTPSSRSFARRSGRARARRRSSSDRTADGRGLGYRVEDELRGQLNELDDMGGRGDGGRRRAGARRRARRDVGSCAAAASACPTTTSPRRRS